MELTNFNNIALNLEILAEECAEVIHLKSKIIRFGLYDIHPVEKQSNQQLLNKELGDLICMVDILAENNVVTWDEIRKYSHKKRKKLKDWYKDHTSERQQSVR